MPTDHNENLDLNRQTRRAVKKVAKKTSGRTTPKKRPAVVPDAPTSEEEWIQEAEVELTGVPLALPSGKTALVRPLGVLHFLRAGNIPNPLRPFIENLIEQASGKGPKKEPDVEAETAKFIEDLKEHPENFAELMQFVDSVTVEAVEKPTVKPVPVWSDEPGTRYYTDDEEFHGTPVPFSQRDRALYVDIVDQADKFHIFNFVSGGTRSVERFRDEVAAASVGPVRSGKGVGRKTKSAARA